MRSRQAEFLRHFAIALALALSIVASRAAAQPYDVATSPAPPTAGEPFTVSISGSFPAIFVFFSPPTVDVHGDRIVVHLNGGCLFLCATPTVRALTFTMPPLGPGAYDLTVFPDGPLAGLSGHATFTISAPANYQGLWWSAPAGSEPGWGISIAQQGNALFATWFTYDDSGSPRWLVMPATTNTGDRTYAGTLYRAVGPASTLGGIQAVRSTGSEPVGMATLAFTDDDNGTLTYQVGAVSQSKPITRQVFAAPMPDCRPGAELSAYNFQDLWWEAPAGIAPGWGLSVAHEGDVIFAVLFGYDPAGKGTWIVMPAMRPDGSGVYSGDVYRTTGPAFSAVPWDGAGVSAKASGRGTLVFSSREFGTLGLHLDGSAPVTKTITRQVFSSPATACN